MEETAGGEIRNPCEATDLGRFVESADGETRRNARIGDILVAARFLTRETLEDALRGRGKESRSRIGKFLLDNHLISEDQLLAALSIKFRMSFVDLDTMKPAQDALVAIPRELVNQMQVFPFALSGKTLMVATSQPADPTIFDRLSFTTTYNVELVAARAQQISAKINQYYNSEDAVDHLINELSSEPAPAHEERPESKWAEHDSTVVRLINRILIDAQRIGASDIHLEAGIRNRPMKLRFRVDGECFLAHEIPATYNAVLIARLKIMANLDIAERRKPQSGKLMLQFDDRDMEYRIEITPTVGGHEDAVLRVLTAAKPLPLEDMGFTPANFIKFGDMLTTPHGMILCVGPTGSGKTTTLHSALARINNPSRKIWSAEDPVEIVQEGLRQVQVNPKIGLTFQEALRSFMRADPDVIMIGEIRDVDTAETAVAAALSGHLVFSTLHTNSAIETVTRLVEMGIEPYFFVDALVGVLAQRLARRLCVACKEEYYPSKGEYDELIRHFGRGFALKHGLPPYSDSLTLMRKKGCDVCMGSGYKGRIAVHELLPADPVIKEAIKAKANVETLRRIALQEGMLTLKMDGISKVFRGITDLAQVMKVCLE